jgi:hypothetical protein
MRTGLVPAHGFLFFLAALAVDAQGGHRPGLKTRHADLLPALLAQAVGPVLQALDGSWIFL